MTRIHPYKLFGLSIRSELPLPGFEYAESERDSVQVRFASLAPTRDWLAVVDGDALQFEVNGVGRFRISAGREIIIDPASGASDRNVRAVLLGSAFGALLHQCGLLPLHANAVEIEGSAVAFIGSSGAGKSTLAGWFADRGHRILCDDVCAVRCGPGGPLVLPGVPRLRLWSDALENSGRCTSRFERSFDGDDKYDVPVTSVTGPLRLAACYILDEPGCGSELTVKPFVGAGAAQALIAHTYRGLFVPLIGRTEHHFRACVEVATKVPVLGVARRWGREAFEEQARAMTLNALKLIHGAISARSGNGTRPKRRLSRACSGIQRTFT